MTTSRNGKGSLRRGYSPEADRAYAEGWDKIFAELTRRKKRKLKCPRCGARYSFEHGMRQWHRCKASGR